MAAGHNAKFGVVEMVIFLLALISGTGCSLTSKALLDMKGINMNGEIENFSFPLFQTFGMFLGGVYFYLTLLCAAAVYDCLVSKIRFIIDCQQLC